MRTLETTLLLTVQLLVLRLLERVMLVRLIRLMKDVVKLLFTLPNYR